MSRAATRSTARIAVRARGRHSACPCCTAGVAAASSPVSCLGHAWNMLSWGQGLGRRWRPGTCSRRNGRGAEVALHVRGFHRQVSQRGAPLKYKASHSGNGCWDAEVRQGGAVGSRQSANASIVARPVGKSTLVIGTAAADATGPNDSECGGHHHGR